MSEDPKALYTDRRPNAMTRELAKRLAESDPRLAKALLDAKQPFQCLEMSRTVEVGAEEPLAAYGLYHEVLFFQQGESSDCVLYSLANAALWMRAQGNIDVPPPPTPGSVIWQGLVHAGLGEFGPILQGGFVASYLGLRLGAPQAIPARWVPPEGSLWDVTVRNPRRGSSLHSALCIGHQEDRLLLVNYRGVDGPAVEVVDADACLMPEGNVNRRMRSISR